jgi:hypothetical protein
MECVEFAFCCPFCGAQVGVTIVPGGASVRHERPKQCREYRQPDVWRYLVLCRDRFAELHRLTALAAK